MSLESKIAIRSLNHLPDARMTEIRKTVDEAPDCPLKEMGLDLLGELLRRSNTITSLTARVRELGNELESFDYPYVVSPHRYSSFDEPEVDDYGDGFEDGYEVGVGDAEYERSW